MADTRSLEGLRERIDRAGYYPDLVAEAVETSLAGESIKSYLVHQETTFDGEEVRRHVTVLVLTPTRLLVGHTDDSTEPGGSAPVATTSTEAVPISAVRSVVVTRVVPDPARHLPGTLPHEVTLTVGWGAVSRLDLEPASCSDPECEADHGYTGTATADDLPLRVSAAADGPDAVGQALEFARALSAATATAVRH
ncbi:DUF5998 family protein [Motilibacter deserti]|uniref:Phosphodiesterase n=1 Tax=Motilibacter deserti TaxID=2714956 RepID=A0ABX0GSH3_9ACTN|nr:DUF5998 family protein [Motilibacter deserti]NHC13819.1 phosphodiesterase [Motilibacter deserti]